MKVVVLDQICFLIERNVCFDCLILSLTICMREERGGQNLSSLTIVDCDKDSYGGA